MSASSGSWRWKASRSTPGFSRSAPRDRSAGADSLAFADECLWRWALERRACFKSLAGRILLCTGCGLAADDDKIGTVWTDEEPDLILADYFAMLAAEQAGRAYVKSHHSGALMAQIGRRHRSVEFKHMNISAVLAEIGQSRARRPAGASRGRAFADDGHAVAGAIQGVVVPDRLVLGAAVVPEHQRVRRPADSAGEGRLGLDVPVQHLQ